MNILIVDTETTGLDPEKDAIIEVGMILYNTEHRCVIAELSHLVDNDTNAAEEINHIPVGALKESAEFSAEAAHFGGRLISMSEYIIAHNAEFDRNFFKSHGVEPSQPWICTKNDVVWPIRKGASLSLINICAELGVPIINAHRALNDCRLLVGALEKMPDIASFLLESGKGRKDYIALVSYEDREKAKAAGFAWQPTSKQWVAKMKESDVAALPFKVREL